MLGVAAGGLAAAGVALASIPVWSVQKSPNPGRNGYTHDLYGVAATSTDNAWAVGAYIKGAVAGPIEPARKVGTRTTRPGWRTVVERWNGQTWKLQASPNPGGTKDSYLDGVAATSPDNAWAVGYYEKKQRTDLALIEHWDGQTWKTEKSSSGSHVSELLGVAATSPSNAWAVGYLHNGTDRPLIEHWNGKSWNTQKSPNPSASGHDTYLDGVAATSPDNAWAVGEYYNGTVNQTLIEHWNGKTWKVQSSPDPSGSSNNNYLDGVTATGPDNAWAVGFSDYGSTDQTLIEHWNGKTWKVQPSVDPSGSTQDNLLLGIAATSSKNAWAVGWDLNSSTAETMVQHWDGTEWTIQASANPGTYGAALYGVTAVSSRNAWAVGERSAGELQKTLIEHGP